MQAANCTATIATCYQASVRKLFLASSGAFCTTRVTTSRYQRALFPPLRAACRDNQGRTRVLICQAATLAGTYYSQIPVPKLVTSWTEWDSTKQSVVACKELHSKVQVSTAKHTTAHVTMSQRAADQCVMRHAYTCLPSNMHGWHSMHSKAPHQHA